MIKFDDLDYLSTTDRRIATANRELFGGNHYKVGQKVGGYTLIKKYEHFWLWRYQAPNGEFYNECFFKGFNPCDIEIDDDED